VCGAEGQLCCDGASCGSQLLCATENQCRHCGAPGEACCAAPPGCAGALSCNDGKCDACDGACSLGAQRCTANNGIETCQPQAGVCPSFVGVLASCGAGQSCELDGGSAACIEKCPGACVIDSFVCSTHGNLKCVVVPGASCPVWVTAAVGTGPICPRGACTSTGLCWESPTPLGAELVGIAGWAEDQFVVLDELGNLIRNNSESWSYEVRGNSNTHPRAVANCNPGVWLAVGDDGLFLRRYNGSWTPEQLGDPTAQLRAVSCDGLGRAVAVGQIGKVFIRGENGGFTRPNSGTSRDLNAVAYDAFSNKAFALGEAGLGIRCSGIQTPATATCSSELDGALSNQTIRSACVDLAGRFWAVGDNGTALDYSFMTGWQTRGGFPMLQLRGVVGSGNAAFAVGAAGTFATAHSNGVWFQQKLGPEDLNAVFLSVDNSNTENAVIAAGSAGALFLNRSTGAAPANWLRVGGNAPATEDLNAVTRLEQDVWAVGENGAVYHRVDDAWRREPQALTTASLKAIVAVSSHELYAFGAAGTVLARRNGIWSVEAAGLTDQSLNGAACDGKTVYAVGSQGTWLEKPVGAAGTAWKKVSHGKTSAALYAVVVQPSSNGAIEVNAVGDECTLLTRTGASFSAQSLPACQSSLRGAWEGPTGELYVVGTNAWCARRPAANAAFAREYVGLTLQDFTSIAASPTQAWITGGLGELYHRVNGNWYQEEAELTHVSLKGAWLSGSDLYVVGEGGLIWHRQ
jgi:hypothetical protein